MHRTSNLTSVARGVRVGLAALALAAGGSAQAQLFPDNEARRAIVELRERVNQGDADTKSMLANQAQTLDQLRRSLLELNGQIESLRGEIARLRGQNEQLTRDLSEVQRQQKDIVAGVEDRMRKLEPQKVTLDGREFQADNDEKRQYDEAITLLRNGDFNGAANAFGAFVRRWPASGYQDTAQFWLGNALYGKRDYAGAITAFRTLLANNPSHARAPEALLAVANCQIEMKDTKAARATLADVSKLYPRSEAAQAAKERLAALK